MNWPSVFLVIALHIPVHLLALSLRWQFQTLRFLLTAWLPPHSDLQQMTVTPHWLKSELSDYHQQFHPLAIACTHMLQLPPADMSEAAMPDMDTCTGAPPLMTSFLLCSQVWSTSPPFLYQSFSFYWFLHFIAQHVVLSPILKNNIVFTPLPKQ